MQAQTKCLRCIKHFFYDLKRQESNQMMSVLIILTKKHDVIVVTEEANLSSELFYECNLVGQLDH